MTYGELSPAELARNTLLLPAFKDTVSADEYRELLRHMLQEEYLQRIENGGIIIGLKGEKITDYYSFYAVFQDEETYRVMSKDEEIGTLTNCPAVKAVFVLAGQAWKVVSIDEARKIIYVSEAQNTKIPSWTGRGGDIHARVVQRMKQVLLENTIYPYLRPNAQDLLAEAREYARENGLLNSEVFPCGDTSFFLCPWTGTKEIRTIAKLLSCGLKEDLDIFSVVSSYHYLQVTSGLGVEECIRRFHELKIDLNDPDMVLPQEQTPKIDKYDPMVPENLLRSAFLHNQMDVSGAVQILKGIGLNQTE